MTRFVSPEAAVMLGRVYLNGKDEDISRVLGDLRYTPTEKDLAKKLYDGAIHKN
ncbi:hypothetical protein HN747_01785 [archaeon]|jgi:hypothetical protein|nr:hypothetical protein [archaeon]